MLEVVHWCSLCNKRPADGTLTIVDELDEVVEIPACYPCVMDVQRQQEEEIEGFYEGGKP